MIKTRTVVQIRTHAQKYFQKMSKSGVNCDFDDIGFQSSFMTDEQMKVLLILLLLLIFTM